MKKTSLIVAIVLSALSVCSIVYAEDYVSEVEILAGGENLGSDTSHTITGTFGQTIDITIVAQDQEGHDIILDSSETEVSISENDFGPGAKLEWGVSGSWPESENIMHGRLTIPSSFSVTQVGLCRNIVITLTTRVLTAHNQYTDTTRERTVRVCLGDGLVYECSDKIDNDRDGAIDYPEDFGCTSRTDQSELNPLSQCQDKKDNDGDGLIDLQDPGCLNSQDDDETDIVATPSPTLPPTFSPSSSPTVEPTSPGPTETPSFEPTPIIGLVSPSPSIKPFIDLGSDTSAPVAVAATTIATTAAAISVINIVPGVASASTQALSFGNFLFGIYFKKRKRPEHWVKVVDSITGKGIGGAMIQVRTTDGKVRTIWRTDEKTGNTGDLLPPGQYEFVVTKTGWRFPSYIQPIFAKQKGDLIYRRGIIEVDNEGKVIVKGDKNE